VNLPQRIGTRAAEAMATFLADHGTTILWSSGGAAGLTIALIVVLHRKFGAERLGEAWHRIRAVGASLRTLLKSIAGIGLGGLAAGYFTFLSVQPDLGFSARMAADWGRMLAPDITGARAQCLFFLIVGLAHLQRGARDLKNWWRSLPLGEIVAARWRRLRS
jgi:hypothetical protein